MAKCKYLLKLPGGETIELPAGFDSLENSDTLNENYAKYKAETDEDKQAELLSNLASFIKTKVPSQINGNTINNIIKKSNTVEEVYQKINDLINQVGTYENIEAAVINYVKEFKKGEANKKLAELKSKLLRPRSSTYFKEFGATGVLGVTNLKQEKNRIFSKNLENEEFGFNTSITSNLHTFLTTLNSKYFSNNQTSLIYGVTNPMIGKAWSTDDFIIYEIGNDLSLFLGLFKKEAVKVDPALLTPIIEKINGVLKTKKNGKIDLEEFDIEYFFKGKLENNKIAISQFEQLLIKARDADIAAHIDSIISLVAKTINPNKSGLSKALKTLFWHLNPETYGRNNLFKQLEDIKFVEEESKIEQEYKRSLLSFGDMDSNSRNLYYAKSETIEDDVYENAVKNIVLHKDIVKFPSGTLGVYALVTHIYDRGGDGVAVYGVYKNQFGEWEDIKHVFKSGELIYRKWEGPISPYDQDELIAQQTGALIKSDTPLPQQVVKQLIQKGDIVKGDLVLGVYPAYLFMKRPSGKTYNLYYSDIKSLSSAKALQQIHEERNSTMDNYKTYVQVKDGNDLVAGDLFLYTEKGSKFYKHILFTDATKVYSWVEDGKGNYIVKGTPKADLKGLHNAQGQMTMQDIIAIRNEVEQIGRSKATMSSFNDISMAKPGDFLYYTMDDVKIYGKVLENDKVLLYDGKLQNRMIVGLDYFTIPLQFFTTRDISTNYALFTARANSWAVEFKQEADDPLDVQVEYYIPEGTDITSMVMLASGYANIGSYKESAFKEPTDILVTDKILKALDKPEGTKVFVKKESSESDLFNRNLTSLVWMNYFDNLDSKTKEDLNVIIPGSYFSLYKNGEQIDRNIYRITSVKGDVVKAQMNKLSPFGKIITNEVELSLEDLLQTRKDKSAAPAGSIARLYLQTGNTKVSAVFDETNKLYNKTAAEGRSGTNKSIGLLINKFKNYIKGSGITVKLVPHSNIFKDDQYAAIITDETGKTIIAISDKIGQTEDVVHEFLHLFLTPLRYRHPEIYDAFIKSVVTDTSLNVSDAEEEFVKHVVSKINRKEDFAENFENLQTFVTGLKTILTDVDPEYEISEEENPVTLLKTPLMTLFDIDKNDTSHPMYNLGLITTEPMMREWMRNNNITLNCT